ncbi:MAG: hypothetical protein WDN08_08560 [Rhizomicrobium sp.]
MDDAFDLGAHVDGVLGLGAAAHRDHGVARGGDEQSDAHLRDAAVGGRGGIVMRLGMAGELAAGNPQHDHHRDARRPLIGRLQAQPEARHDRLVHAVDGVGDGPEHER